MKIAPLAAEIAKYPDRFEFALVHTGQHYDNLMNDVFFSELGIPEPDVHLGVGSGSQAEQTARIMLEFEKVASGIAPHVVVVVGDVNSTIAAALVAAKLGIAVAHVEAGLRSRDRRMPEEINRVVTDALADILYTPSRLADRNLLDEGVAKEKISLVGNIMIDSLIGFLEPAGKRKVAAELGLPADGYGLVTLHRPANVDNREILAEIVAALVEVSRSLPLVFPVHPRTVKMLAESGLDSALQNAEGISLIEPLGYLDFLCLMKSARLAISDSGGVQEETTYLGIPCITLRENTERPETILEGTNTLAGHNRELIVRLASDAAEGRGKTGGNLEFWDGKVAGRIVDDLEQRRAWLMTPHDQRVDRAAIQLDAFNPVSGKNQ
ncbi:MAG: UDP-N-acetylglucosamine 2-epimerase (non-hydrolyzing) [Candidatus Glassbacteria bacterium]|nr:UDP-N-acetylglucosamine 2-epimerase (non-hydrolyzing) [Candidatus Glassbacteria bacterium]